MEFSKISPGSYKPVNVGDSVEGVLISIQDNAKYKEGGKIYHLESSKGEQFIVFGTTVLDDRMSYIKIGEYCKIVYQGMKKNAKGQNTKLFDVFKGTLPASA